MFIDEDGVGMGERLLARVEQAIGRPLESV